MTARVALAALAALTLAAQDKPEDLGTVFRTETRLVVCHTTVVDANGRLVTNLPKSAFTVYEDNVRQEIAAFKREDIPVSIGLVIDNSGSMQDKRARVEAAALALVKESNPDDEVFIVNFSDVANIDNPKGKDFTSDVKEMEEALKQIGSRGGTAMRDALRMAIDHARRRGSKEKRVLVVVTDGADNESLVSQENLIRAAQQADVLIYSVGLLAQESPQEAAKARQGLGELASATGALAFFPSDASEVDRIARQVAREIRDQYTIEYSPSNTAMDGSYRQIRITVDAPGIAAVRTRKGYYAGGAPASAPGKKTSQR